MQLEDFQKKLENIKKLFPEPKEKNQGEVGNLLNSPTDEDNKNQKFYIIFYSIEDRVNIELTDEMNSFREGIQGRIREREIGINKVRRRMKRAGSLSNIINYNNLKGAFLFKKIATDNLEELRMRQKSLQELQEKLEETELSFDNFLEKKKEELKKLSFSSREMNICRDALLALIDNYLI